MTISLKLIDSVDEIEKKINEALSEKLNSALIKSSSKILDEVKKLIPQWINSQPEIQALNSGNLIGQFGITISASSIINAIIQSVVNSTTMSIKKYDKKLKNGGLELYIQPSDFQNLLSLPEGHTVYRDLNFSGDLHWLNWLLTRGDEVIIVGYEYNPKNGIGRSRLGNMVKGGSFRIPPQFSGTSDNNFITRSLLGQEQEKAIASIFQNILGGP
jgi:hypothetical protein